MQMPENIPELFDVSLALGFALLMLFVIATWIGSIWIHTWAWIDDAKPANNPIAGLICRLRGWPESPSYAETWVKKDGRHAHDVDAYLPVAVTAFFAPIVLIFGFRFYPIALTVLTIIAVAHVARFARRHKKLFDKHVKDPEAHK